MIMKRFSLVSLVMLVLLWLLPAGVASAAEAVASPHDMLAPGYAKLLDDMLFEDVVEVNLLPEDITAGEAALASAPDPDPMSFLQVVDIITSKKIEKNDLGQDYTVEKIDEPVGTLSRLSKSMWYNDGDFARQDITVWDNQGKVKHYR